MKIILLFLLTLSITTATQAVASAPFSHELFDTILREHVKDGRVNYKALKQNHQSLQHYLTQLEQVNATEFETWPREEKLAFWINAYNAITLEGIVRNYPIQGGTWITKARFPQNSIRQIRKFWDTGFIMLMGKKLTLNQIEHNILRKQFNEPRIHFVIVCASIGCPVLESRAFFAKNLNERLETATQNFINDAHKVRLDKDKNLLYVSSIFDWYKQDFPPNDNQAQTFHGYKSAEQGIVAYVAAHLPSLQQEFIQKHSPKIKYLDYDWTLNEQ